MSFSLGGLVGGAAQGFTQEQQQALQQKLAQQQQVGQSLAGSALFGGAPQPQQNPLQALLAKFGVGGQPPQPQTMPQPQGGAPPSPMGGGLMPSVGGAPQPPAQGGAPMPPQQPQAPAPQPQQGAFQGGQLTLDQAVQRINQVKPNATPQEKMAALSQILPIMNAQSQAQYRQIMAQLAPARLAVQQENVDERKRYDKVKEGQGDARVDQGQQRIDNQKLEFDQRQKAAGERFDATLKEKYDALEATNDRSQAVQLATDVRAAIKERFSNTRTEIMAANPALDPDQQKKLMDKAVADRTAATARLDAALAAQKAHAASSVVKPNADGSKRTEKPPLSTRAPAEVVPGKEIKALPPDEIGKAKAAIKSGQISREDMVKALQEQGYDTSGL